HNDPYTTVAVYDSPTTDLRIWKVDKPFPTYAPLSSGIADIGATATIIGRGRQRGDEVIVSGQSKGWKWGVADNVQRWGRNVVVDELDDAFYGKLLYCDFDKPGIPNECHLSEFDSGGSMYVLENGLWRLAGINLGVDGRFRMNAMDNPPYFATLFDIGGLQIEGPVNVFTNVPDTASDVPSSFYCSRISPSLSWIMDKAPGSNTLALETYSAWQRLYFTPADIAATATSNAAGDFDQDGIENLLEFALNLDPAFREQVTMTPATGIRGLPVVRRENISGEDRLTIEFVRRSAASGAGLTYTPEFSSDLTAWSSAGTTSVTTINPRWERVKVIDTLTSNDTTHRCAHLKVTLSE
ncbi:MAG: hypothetical protein KGQ89_06620, partial [Verrucomicrobia bacterium]|nr:hypothetical protein [Verrucomicrobiota bacterium]